MYKESDAQELDTQEKQLGLLLPPSYKTFVLKNGLYGRGKNNNCERHMFLPLFRLPDSFSENWGIDPESAFPKDEKQQLDNLISLSYGDEELQITWFHCFDYNSLNKETGEVDIIDFDQDEVLHIGKLKSEICSTNGFDVYMQTMIDNAIDNILGLFE